MERTWVDRGGTFTDVVRWRPGAPPSVEKIPSDRAVVGDLARGHLVLGTTVATNALLERRVVPTVLFVTEGFADLVRIRHMARPELFDPEARWPRPLAQRIVEVPGRISIDGTLLQPPSVPASLHASLEGMEAAAVAFLHSLENPEHERRWLAILRERRPDLHTVASHQVTSTRGYVSRIETTLVDAAVTPVLRRALARDRVPTGSRAIQSDGALVPAEALRAPDAVLSGPAGGVLAVRAIARQAGLPGAVGLDMGGTSTDVCCVVGDRLPHHDEDVLVAGVGLQRGMLEVETIAAGGGSVLRHDGVQLRVGPASAGADPGPQVYGRGGPPTLTDAAVALGLVDPDAFSPPLAVDRVDLPGPAEDFVAIAREAMAGAVRRIAARRGVDIRPLGLVAYGGAAGQHAAGVAERLGIRVVLIHPLAAALSAWGQTLAAEERGRTHPIDRPLAEALEATRGLAEQAVLEAGSWSGEDHFWIGLRHLGTDHVLALPWALEDDEGAVVEAFREEHRRIHGFDREGAVIEVAWLRHRRRAPRTPIPDPADDPWGLGDAVVEGPARLDCPTTSVWVPRGWRARRADGLLRLEHHGAPPTAGPTVRTPAGVALWGHRFAALAAEAGERLRRLARSVNIRERRDFSCAVFDGEGRLVANAPHIPVHLGAMGETVRDVLTHEPHAPDGSAWLTNDPAAGGSHLPDLTVVCPVDHGDRRFWVACRGHHVDVGGLTPGSMPPHATRLDEEGVVFRRVPLLEAGRWRDLSEALSAVRHPDEVVADLHAQVAACRAMADGLRDLGPPDVVAAWMDHLRAAAADAVRLRLRTPFEGTAADRMDGIPLQVRVRCDGRTLDVDFEGTGAAPRRNLHAPRAVVRAALLFVLRVWAGEDLPLNEGALEPLRWRVPHGSLLDPPAGAPVAGGNVETSQRVVDLLFRALGLRAAAQGTMNNLTLGGDGWSHYETLGGGDGASPAGPGASARQVHMTNTRATDPEILEARMPLRVVQTAVRRGSGGDGAHRGGDGLVRELEVLATATASLLATRRDTGAPGAAGGGPGLPGRQALRRGGRWASWDGTTVTLGPGDRVRVETPGGGGWGAPTHGDGDGAAPR